jgi:hypothetical protein
MSNRSYAIALSRRRDPFMRPFNCTIQNSSKQRISPLPKKSRISVRTSSCPMIDRLRPLEYHEDSSNSSSDSSSLSTMRSSIDAYRQHFFNNATTEAAKSFLLTMRNLTSSATAAIGTNHSNLQIKKTKRRSRAAFSHAQVIELERRFAQQKYLSSTERAELATLLSVSPFSYHCHIPFDRDSR